MSRAVLIIFVSYLIWKIPLEAKCHPQYTDQEIRLRDMKYFAQVLPVCCFEVQIRLTTVTNYTTFP